MKKFMKLMAASALALAFTGCTVIDTGEVGLRVGFDKKVNPTELVSGSFNQTIIGSVLTFPIKDVPVEVNDLQPLSKDNSTMKDVDVTMVYNLNPSCVSDLYINKSRSFHAVDNGDTFLMYTYLKQTVRNAVYKVARDYDAMTMNDNRANIETSLKTTIAEMLAKEKLDACINVTAMQARALVPSDALKQAADNLVRAKTEEQTKTVEVQIAKKEAERIAALNANAGAINYMNAQANMEIAKGIASGKVHSIVVPYDFKGIVNAGNK